MVEICGLTKEYFKKWDDYVQKSKDATFYHQLGWKKVIENSLGHRPYYLIAKRKNTISGILPLFLLKNFFFGTSLVSVPAANYAGICADDKETEERLLESAKRLTRELNADFLELRDIKKNTYDLEENNNYATFLVSLDPEPEVVWSRFKKAVRQKIRKAIKSGLILSQDLGRLDDYYRIYCHNMKRLGSPHFSKSFFKEILKQFPGKANLIFAEYKNKTIASDIVVQFKDVLMTLFAGAYKKYLWLCPNNFICWKEIEYACKKGYKIYDFGRSQLDSGSFNFKKYWYNKPKQLYYYYYLNNITRLPMKNITNWPYWLYVKVWKRLPFLFTKNLGPKIVKYLH